MRTVIIAGTAGLMLGMGLTACSSGPRTLSQPAPPSALECALRITADSGFVPSQGGVSSGYLIVERRHGWSKGEVADEATHRFLTMGLSNSGHAALDIMHITAASGSLSITPASVDGDRKGVKATDDVMQMTRIVFNSCARS